MNLRINLFFPLILIILISFGCDNNNSGGGTDPEGLPTNPNDWVCPDSVIDISQGEIDTWCAKIWTGENPRLLL